MGRKILAGVKKDLIKKFSDNKKHLLLFLDYDGTIAPIKKRPELARLSQYMRTILKAISKNPDIVIFIISGRALSDIKKLVGLKNIYYSGNHGIEFSGGGLDFVYPKAKVCAGLMEKLFKKITDKVCVEGAVLENKKYTLSLHYRMVDDKKINLLKKAFWNTIRPLLKKKKIKVIQGKKVFEIRPNIKWNKGDIVKWILSRFRNYDILPLYIGDDKTDEDAFRVLKRKGITILVSGKRQKTDAQYRIRSIDGVRRLLSFISRYK